EAAGQTALRVFLDAPEPIRAVRIAGREGGGTSERLREIQAREASDARRYRVIYGVDYHDPAHYDLVLHSDGRSPEELAADTVEHTLATLEQIEQTFGAEIAALVDGVTKISQINFRSREEKQAENFRKMLLAMARDLRVILIKLADRTHNMRTLGHLPPERQVEIAQETLDIYAPLAHRLGINWIKSDLEDNALRFLHPEVYYQLKRSVAKKKAEREKYIKE